MTGDTWFEAGCKHRFSWMKVLCVVVFFSFHLDPALRPSLADFSFWTAHPAASSVQVVQIQNWRLYSEGLLQPWAFFPAARGITKAPFSYVNVFTDVWVFLIQNNLSAPVSHTIVLLSSQVSVFFYKLISSKYFGPFCSFCVVVVFFQFWW